MTHQTERPPTLELPQTTISARLHPRHRQAAALAIVVALLGLVGGVAVGQRLVGPPASPPAPAPAPASLKLTARGQVRPVAQARVGTLGGGVLTRLIVEPGDAVNDGQEIARVRGPGGNEIVTAPFSGTVTGLLARFGDTLAPGAPIATVGDLRRLQVETTDVDEYLIPYVSRGQTVTVVVEALDDELAGRVRTVALEPTRTRLDDEHYPVTIELLETPANLRPGMTARIRFGE